MKKSDVIKHFGGVNATARAMRISPAAVSQWRDDLGDSLALRVEITSHGVLKTAETLRNEGCNDSQ